MPRFYPVALVLAIGFSYGCLGDDRQLFATIVPDGGVSATVGSTSVSTTSASSGGTGGKGSAASSAQSASSATTTGVGGAGGAGGASVDAGSDAAPACAHDLCSAGAALDPACNPCVAAVCEQFPMLGCCTSGWDVSCSGALQTVCGFDCGTAGSCTHSVCTIGGPLPGDIESACSLCAYRICYPEMMPSCCTTAWDATCVALVASNCGPCT